MIRTVFTSAAIVLAVGRTSALDAAKPELSPEAVLPAYADTHAHQPAIAYAPGKGGGTFMVTWQDLRNNKDWDVYAARVSGKGKVLDAGGLLVAGGDAIRSSRPSASMARRFNCSGGTSEAPTVSTARR